MEYIEITKEEAIAIVDGGRTCQMTIIDAAGYPQQTAVTSQQRKLWVIDESGVGTAPVFVRAGEIRVNYGLSGEDEDDVLVSEDEMQSCTWWLGEDDSCSILEARGSNGMIWSGKILGKPGNKEYIHSLVGGPPLPPVQDKEPKYEYKNVYLWSAQYSVEVNRMYQLGWEPVCSAMAYDKEREGTSALFTLRRRIN